MTEKAADRGGPGLFGGAAAMAFTEKLVSADRATAGSMITEALRAVLEAGDDLDATEAESALVTVAVLVSEEDPAVLDGAPDVDALRRQLAQLDTELTPARRTAARGVLTRALLPAANSWLAQRSTEADWPRTRADLERLAELLADA
ncbi:DUF4259 domain-containing protein [Nakamurella lactea]|uniref:DUF4259 domain-containing protein n=1 Tax=Nakamurella lactea TaxID=459515 RepID=UPI0004219CA2|nr:DUF4259 domain-containing protein [Nakamurella lactea]